MQVFDAAAGASPHLGLQDKPHGAAALGAGAPGAQVRAAGAGAGEPTDLPDGGLHRPERRARSGAEEQLGRVAGMVRRRRCGGGGKGC